MLKPTKKIRSYDFIENSTDIIELANLVKECVHWYTLGQELVVPRIILRTIITMYPSFHVKVYELQGMAVLLQYFLFDNEQEEQEEQHSINYEILLTVLGKFNCTSQVNFLLKSKSKWHYWLTNINT